MEYKNKYIKSLELLDKFISETSKDELANIISKYESMDIKGPTLNEYIEYLEMELISIDWNSLLGELIPISYSNDILKYQMHTKNSNYFPSPPIDNINKNSKKDSVYITESFFLLLLQYYGRSTIS